MNCPVTAAPAQNRTLALQLHIEELRAEFANCLDGVERRLIERELRTAEAKLEGRGDAA